MRRSSEGLPEHRANTCAHRHRRARARRTHKSTFTSHVQRRGYNKKPQEWHKRFCNVIDPPHNCLTKESEQWRTHTIRRLYIWFGWVWFGLHGHLQGGQTPNLRRHPSRHLRTRCNVLRLEFKVVRPPRAKGSEGKGRKGKEGERERESRRVSKREEEGREAGRRKPQARRIHNRVLSLDSWQPTADQGERKSNKGEKGKERAGLWRRALGHVHASAISLSPYA